MPTDPVEYGFKIWGGYFNTGEAQTRGHLEGTYFFQTADERDAALESMRAAAGDHGFADSIFEGSLARHRCIASFTLVVGDQRYQLEYDFGYGYDEAGAEYMFMDGNYACDCNRSMMLRRLYGEVPGLPPPSEDDFNVYGGVRSSPCGDTIHMEEFCVRRERGPDGPFLEDTVGERLPPLNA